MIAGSRERVILVDGTGYDILEVSGSCLRRLGLTRGDVLGRRCFEVFHHRARPCSESGETCPVESTVKAGRIVTVAHGHFDRRGQRHVTEIWAIPLKDAKGLVGRALCVFHDMGRMAGTQGARERALVELEKVYTRNNAPVAFLDRRFNYLWVNEAYANLLDKEAAYFPGKGHFRLFPDAAARTIFRKVLDTGEPFFAHARPASHPGGPRKGMSYFDWSLVPIRASDGVTSVEVLVFTLLDVTHRIQAEADLQESEERFRDLYEQAPVSYFTIGPDGRIRGVNPTVKRLLGYEPGELKNRPVFTLYADSPSGKERARRMFRRLLAGEEIKDEELEMKHKDGRSVWIALRVRPVLGDDGRVIESRSIVVDITERKIAQEALRASEEKYRELIENLNDVVYSIDDAGYLTYVSPAVERMLGYAATDLIGKRLSALIFEADRPRMIEGLKKGIEGILEPSEYRLVTKTQDARWVRTSSRLLRSGETVVGLTGTLTDITERKKAETAVMESEEKYRLVTENLPVAIYSVLPDERSTPTFISGRIRELTGYSVEELSAAWNLWALLVAPQNRQSVLDIIRSHLDKGIPLDMEYRIATKGGLIKWIRDKATPVLDDQGRVIRIDGIMEDITERKNATESLALSEEKYRDLIDNAGSGVITIDPGGRLTLVNKSFCRMSGYLESELLGRPFTELLHPEDEGAIRALFNDSAHAAMISPHLEFRILRKDGSTVHCHSSPTMSTKDSTVTGFHAIIHDITERTRAEEDLQKLASVVHHASELVNMATVDGRMIFLNEAGSRMLGIAPGEVGRYNILDIIPDGLQKKLQEEVVPALMDKGSWEGDLQYRNLRTGRLTDVRATAFAVRNPRTGAVAYLANVSLDITDRKRTEEALARSFEKLKVVDRMRTEFIDIASHELRTPLTTIKIYLDLMTSGKIGKFTDDERIHLRDIEQCTNDLNKLISEMLDYTKTDSRLVNVSSESIDLLEVTGNILGNFKALAEVRKIRIDLDSAGNTTAKFDVDMIRRAISNLISNAIKYCDEGGKVNVQLREHGQELLFAVSDTGIGIAKQHLPHIFDRFYIGDTTLTRERDRLGLGLPIVKSIIKKHGGRIWAESELGKGSTFYFTLPKSRAKRAVAGDDGKAGAGIADGRAGQEDTMKKEGG